MRLELHNGDWRHSSALLGVYRYLKYFDCDFKKGIDYIEFDENDITKERYLLYVEETYDKIMRHKRLEEFIEKGLVKEANQIMSSNTTYKKIFKIKFDGENKEDVLRVLNENRLTLIESHFTFNIYDRFCNKNLFFSEASKCCRVNSYYVDLAKKSKSLSWGFDNKAFDTEDTIYFDFILLGFSNSDTPYFINANMSVDSLSRANYSNEEFYTSLTRMTKHMFYDVEVILNDVSVSKNIFKTFFLTKDRINDILSVDKEDYKDIDRIFKLSKVYTLTKREYINPLSLVSELIIKSVDLSKLLNILLKEDNAYLVGKVAKINSKLKRGDNMRKEIGIAISDAIKVKQNIEKNKLLSYEKRLVTCLCSNNYDKFKQVLLQLSSYSQVHIRCSTLLFEDFERNKDLAYVFVNSLKEIKVEK